jgi:dTDP-4-dehydrorhamnose reductase
MKLLLLGADGQVGYELHRALAPLGEVVAATLKGVLPGGARCASADLEAREALAGLIREVHPTWIVNAAAYTAVDRAEDEADLARRINAEAVGQMGIEAQAIGAGVVHYSTDYVFGGDATRPYREDDPTAPLGVYGRTKLAGEQALRESGAPHLILRTAWVYAARGHNFLLTMLKLARERDRLRVVADQHGAPTPARWLAATTAALLARLGAAPTPGARLGTYHVVAGGETTWHGFAEAIVGAAQRAGLIERAVPVEAITAAEFPTRARRPTYSVLDTGRLAADHGLMLPNWRVGLEQCIAELAESAGPA